MHISILIALAFVSFIARSLVSRDNSRKESQESEPAEAGESGKRKLLPFLFRVTDPGSLCCAHVIFPSLCFAWATVQLKLTQQRNEQVDRIFTSSWRWQCSSAGYGHRAASKVTELRPEYQTGASCSKSQNTCLQTPSRRKQKCWP